MLIQQAMLYASRLPCPQRALKPQPLFHPGIQHALDLVANFDALLDVVEGLSILNVVGLSKACLPQVLKREAVVS